MRCGLRESDRSVVNGKAGRPACTGGSEWGGWVGWLIGRYEVGVFEERVCVHHHTDRRTHLLSPSSVVPRSADVAGKGRLQCLHTPTHQLNQPPLTPTHSSIHPHAHTHAHTHTRTHNPNPSHRHLLVRPHGGAARHAQQRRHGAGRRHRAADGTVRGRVGVVLGLSGWVCGGGVWAGCWGGSVECSSTVGGGRITDLSAAPRTSVHTVPTQSTHPNHTNHRRHGNAQVYYWESVVEGVFTGWLVNEWSGGGQPL